MLRDDTRGVSRQDRRHEAAEDDEERRLVADLVQQSDERALGTLACLRRALLLGHVRAAAGSIDRSALGCSGSISRALT